MPFVAHLAPLAHLAQLALPSVDSLAHVGQFARAAVRWLSLHTGIPALLVAAVLLVVGYKILKKSARLLLEIALVAALLVAATHAGWLRW